MNEKNLKVIMELLFIFIVPLLIIAAGVSVNVNNTVSGEVITASIKTFSYSSVITNNGVLFSIKDLLSDVFNINTGIVYNLIFDYNLLWIINFTSWHFLYALLDFVVHLPDKFRR